MATESPIRMSETGGKWGSRKKPAKLAPSSANRAAEDLKLLLRGHKFHSSGNDVAPNRSGSAPPSMEGSFLAINNLLSQQDSSITGSWDHVIERSESEEQLRYDPAYLAYYCANVNLNPRLPPPLISWENRRLARHIGSFSQSSGPVDDSGNGSLQMSQGLLPTHQEESEDDHSPQQASSELVDQANGICSEEEATEGIGQQKNEDSCGSTSPPDSCSHNLNKGVSGEVINHSDVSNSVHDVPLNSMASISPTVGAKCTDDTVIAPNDESSSSPVAISSSPAYSRSTGVNGTGVILVESGMKSLNISSMPEGKKNSVQFQHSYQNNFMQYQINQQQFSLSQVQNATSQLIPSGVNCCTYIGTDQYLPNTPKFAAEAHPVIQTSGFTHPVYANTAAYMSASPPYYSNFQAQSFVSPHYVGGYALNPPAFSPYVGEYHPPGAVPVVFDGTVGSSYNARTSGGGISPDMQPVTKSYGQLGFPLQTSFSDPMYLQYYQQPLVESLGVSGQYAPVASGGSHDLKKGSNHAAYLDDQKLKHHINGGLGNLNPQRGGSVTASYFGSAPHVGVLVQYPTSPLSFVGPGRNSGLYPGWPGHQGFKSHDDPKIYNFLEELRSGKGRRFELSDIAGHIVEFSSDQHGSRFIQQKLENCSVEEKASVFREVLPHACKLMTDVFGNYVIQKFFEYGSPQQRKDLANQLSGQILPLSLQMYGCRVIQKALENIELEQKARLVHELNGHVMRCVRDQNGNHVIQKCIESIPTEKIAFIISAFHGQVATLSMHPYGCRVIQRVLEHCTNKLQCQFIVDEILESVRALAQDQYGNYVSQHVLERGKPHERSRIISKLSGHIVQLSQHKFASNVVEKCLKYGNATEREMIFREIVGHNEGNDNLLVMMKDQFGNYVVQKTLEICTDSQRMLLISRIRAHTNALKKYTYGKHIVARFEQLFGEEKNSGH